MHIVVGELSAHYTGRGDTILARYNRIVILKGDGTVSIHSDKGFKPLNYMATKSDFEETIVDGERTWTFKTKKEQLAITFHHVYDEINLPLGDNDPGHESRSGTESQLQEWLSTHLNLLDPDLEFKHREYQTGDGPVDLLAERKSDNAMIAIEVKRVAPMNTVGQVLRYVDALEELHPDRQVIGMIAAVEFKEKTRIIAAKKNVVCLEVPIDWMNENLSVKKAPQSLFEL